MCLLLLCAAKNNKKVHTTYYTGKNTSMTE